MAASRDLPSSMSNLRIDTAKSKQKSAPVADSWDDEDDDEEANSDDDMRTPTTPTRASSPPKVPPPTPASPFQSSARDRAAQLPQFSFGGQGGNPGLAFSNNMASDNRDRRRGDDERRPEKSAAAASRLIAGALGVRAPKMTEEQREYEKAVREKERSRRMEEKQRKEQEAKGRLAAWED